MGLLPVQTEFKSEKTRAQTKGKITGLAGAFRDLNGSEFEGYEIHMGLSGAHEKVISNGNVYGTYVHGIFDKCAGRVLECICREKGISALAANTDTDALREREFDKLALLVRESLDMDMIYKILRKEI